MALGDNTAFFNETTFLLGDEQSGTTGISGIDITAVGGGAIDSPAAKVLFTLKEPLSGEAGPFTALINDDVRDRILEEGEPVLTSYDYRRESVLRTVRQFMAVTN